MPPPLIVATLPSMTLPARPLKSVRVRGAVRIRLGEGRRGDVLFPAEAGAERVKKARERAARMASAAEVARLRALLAKARG